MTHVNKMSEASLDGESETDRAIWRERKKCSICFLSRCNDEERCPANTRSSNSWVGSWVILEEVLGGR